MENNEKIWHSLMELSMICGMNQRYAQEMLTSAQWHSNAIDIAVVVTTMLTLALGVAAYVDPNRTMPVLPYWWRGAGWSLWRVKIDLLATVTSILAAIAGVVLVVSPYSENVRHYGNMFQAWSDLRQDVDSALIDVELMRLPEKQGSDSYLEQRYRDLLAKKNALNAREPAPNEELLEKALIAEERSRGSDMAPVPGPDTTKASFQGPSLEKSRTPTLADL